MTSVMDASERLRFTWAHRQHKWNCVLWCRKMVLIFLWSSSPFVFPMTFSCLQSNLWTSPSLSKHPEGKTQGNAYCPFTSEQFMALTLHFFHRQRNWLELTAFPDWSLALAWNNEAYKCHTQKEDSHIKPRHGLINMSTFKVQSITSVRKSTLYSRILISPPDSEMRSLNHTWLYIFIQFVLIMT